MIIFSFLIHQLLKSIYIRIVNKIGSDSVEKYVKGESGVINSTMSQESKNDVEFVLSFDPPVYLQRYSAIQHVLVNSKWRGKVKKVVDFGCAEFGLFTYVKNIIGLQDILFVDVDVATLENNITRLYPLNADYLRRRNEPLNIKVLSGSIADPSIEVMDVDAVICIEIVEHLYPDTLDALPFNIFGVIKPRIAIFTTPNADFNVLFPNFSGIRHWDHKFEWTRQQFEDWAENITIRYPGYTVYFQGIGAGPEGTEKYGECSQMAVFIKSDIVLNSDLELEYKNYFKQKIPPLNTEVSTENVDLQLCPFCEYQQNNTYEFTSYGICSYFSYNKSNNNNDSGCIHYKLFYKEIGYVDYPVDIDNRTQDQRILDNALYNIYRLGSYNSRYYIDELDQAEIPLYELIYCNNGELIPEDDLKTILINAGHEIKLCDINEQKTYCVVYTPYDTMSKSSHRTKSTDNINSKDDYLQLSDSESNWDEDIRNGESEISGDSLPPQNLFENTEEKELGESSNNPNTKLECIYDSGCSLTSSSIELVTPELIKTMQLNKIDRNIDAIKAKSEQENVNQQKNQLRRQSMNNPTQQLTVVKSEGNIKSQNNTLNADNTLNSIDNDLPSTVDNIELATLQNNEEGVELNLENISLEAVYDSRSENNISDVDLLSEQVQEYQDVVDPPLLNIIPIRILTSNENGEQSSFPSWLLHLLSVSESDSDSVLDPEPHFYSQGDGLGIHPSVSELSTDSSESAVTVRLSGRISPPRIDETEHSDDYFSIDEENFVLEASNNSEVMTLPPLPETPNVSEEMNRNIEEEFRSEEDTQHQRTSSEQSTSRENNSK